MIIIETRHVCLTICITPFPMHCTIHPWIQSWPLFFNHHLASKCKPSNLIEFNLTNHTQQSANEHNQKLNNCSKVFFFFGEGSNVFELVRFGLRCYFGQIWGQMTLLARGITSQRGPYTQKAHIYSSFYFPPIPICQRRRASENKRVLCLSAHLIWQTMFYKIELARVVKTC